MPGTVFTSDLLKIICDSFSVTTGDGVRLYAMRYRGQRVGPKRRNTVAPLPGGVLLLPDSGTTINGLEPTILALMQAVGGPDKVITFDRRGHGRSSTGDLETIGPDSTANDIIAVCDASGLHHTNAIANGRAAFGLLATAPKRPTLLRRFVLNDGGPQLDGVGLARPCRVGKTGARAERLDGCGAGAGGHDAGRIFRT